MKRIRNIILGLTVFIFIGCLFAKTAYAEDEGILSEAKQIISNYYIENVPDSVLNAPTVDEMVKSLNDPYSVYFTEDEYNEFIGGINNKFTGIGIYIDIVPQGVKVTSTIKDSPAEKAGIVTGDVIVAADGHSLTGLSSEDALKLIMGDAGTKVSLKILRNGKYFTYNVQRVEITAPTVDGEIINGHTAYIEISSFGENTPDEFRNTLLDLKSKNPANYIIDLRDNPGGYLNAALDIAGYFVGSNTVVKVRDRDGEEENYPGYSHDFIIDKPVIFITNENTASASEVLSGAVKDYKKAFIVGTTTFGKGLVQSMYGLSDGSVIKLTILQFFSPNGNTINKVGISPDFSVRDVDEGIVAELLSGYSGTTSDKTGFVKVAMGDKTFEIDTKLLNDDDQIDAYNYIMNMAVHYGYEVDAGCKEGYVKVSPYYAENYYPYYCSDFTELSTITNAPVDKVFTAKFSGNIDKSSVDNSSIILVDSTTGKSVPLNFEFTDNATVKATSKNNLTSGKTYFFIITDNVKGTNGANLKNGTVSMVTIQ